jgi:hypothetical protein
MRARAEVALRVNHGATGTMSVKTRLIGPNQRHSVRAIKMFTLCYVGFDPPPMHS